MSTLQWFGETPDECVQWPLDAQHRLNHVRLAPWLRRLVAAAIDTLIALAIAYSVSIPVWLATGRGAISDAAGVIWLFLAVAFASAYFALTMRRAQRRNGQTLGKQFLRIRVIRNVGRPVDVRSALIREFLVKFVLGVITGLGWLADGLWALRDGEKRALHDHIAHTHVIAVDAKSAGAFHPVPWRSYRLVGSARPPLDPVVDRLLAAMYAAEAEVRASLPFKAQGHDEVMSELARLVALVEHSLLRVQLIKVALDSFPPTAIPAQLERLPGPADDDAVELERELVVQKRMQEQFERVCAETEAVADALRALAAQPRPDGGDGSNGVAVLRQLSRDVEMVAAGTSDVFV